MSRILAAAAAALALPAVALAASNPVRSVSAPPPAAAPGAAFKVVVKARGHGKVRLLLSRDARAGRGDLALGAAKLRKGRASVRVRVPAGASGSYRLLACEGSRCLAAKRVLKVTGAGSQGGGSTGTGGGGGSAGSTYDGPLPAIPTLAQLDAAPNPRIVKPTADAARAASATVGSSGGTVSASGADGSTYTLVIPAGALIQDTPITLTPVTAIAGLPYAAGAAAAVDIGPDGLLLLKAATLTITSPHDIPIADQGGFSWHGSSGELYRLPLRPTREVSFDLTHFSGYGYAAMTAAERAIDGSSNPTLDLDRYSQAISEVMSTERQAQLSGSEPSAEFADKFNQFMVEAYDEKIRPRLVEATTDDSIAASAMQIALGWERTVQLLYGDNPPAELGSRSAEILPFMVKIVTNAYDKTYEKCMAGEPSYGPRFMAFDRMGQLMGIALPDSFTRFQQCERFELHVDGDLHNAGFASFSEHTHVDVPIRWANDFHLKGSAQPVIDPWTVTSTGLCAAQANGVQYGAPFQVGDLQLRFNLTTERGPDGRDVDEVLPPDVEAVVAPGTPQEQVLYDCANTGQYTHGSFPLWSTNWLQLAPGRDQYGWFHIKDWNAEPGSAPYLRTTIDETLGYASMHLTLDIDHTPGTD